MELEPESQSQGGQPLTFGGVAAFAEASVFRFLGVQLAVALAVAAGVVWGFLWAWDPVLTEAIMQLPEQGEIRGGRLQWEAPSRARLAENSFLTIAADLTGTGQFGTASDLQVVFHGDHVRLGSLLGYLPVPYPHGWIMALNRTELEPWWGAWKTPLTAGIAAGVVVSLWTVWSLLAFPYGWVVRVVAFYADRKVTKSSAWRVAAAAQWPGALLLGAAIMAYSLHHLNLIQLLWAWVVHILLSWLFVIASPFRLPRLASASPFRKSQNPFQGTS